MIVRHLACGALFCAALALPVRLEATTVVAQSFAELCRQAELIFVGTVVEVRSRWKNRDRMEIETAVVFSDVTPVRGAEEGEITLHFAGGEMEGIREEIIGLPRFAPGERVVILARSGTTISPIVGFHQGCFAVVDGPGGPVVRNVDGRPITGVEDGRLRLAAPEAGLDAALPLERFLAVIEQLITAPR